MNFELRVTSSGMVKQKLIRAPKGRLKGLEWLKAPTPQSWKGWKAR